MRARFAIWFAAALSGAAALCYEIVWSRALVVPLGNSTDASAVVLAGFMLGIGVGARGAGAIAERARSPLRVYALLEALLGAYALVAPWLMGLLVQVPAGGWGAGWLLRHGLALGLVVVPGLAMGATLPLLVRVLTAASGLQYQVSLVYGANTLGAAAGAFLTGFFGLALLGVWGCSAAAAGCSLAAAAVALGASVATGRTRGVGPSSEAPAGGYPAHLQKLALAAGFASGFAMLCCEVLWARVLTFVFGHDTYAFASLLAFVLFGLAAGGLLHRALARRDQARVLAALLGLFPVAVLMSFWAAGSVVVRHGRDPLLLEGSHELVSSIWLELYRELLFAPILVLIPSLLAGAIFPAACSVYGAGAPDAGRKTGIFGLVNGVGSALGAIVGAAGLVSLAGIQPAFAGVAVAVGALAALLAVWLGGSARWRAAAAVACVGAAAALAALIPRGLPRAMLHKAVGERHQDWLHYEEGRTGTVAVTSNRVNGEKILWMNGVNEVTTRLVHDQSFKVLGHLGPLLHPAPKRAVMICLGAGLSAGAAMTHPLEVLDVVDLSSSVARGARHFAEENNHVLDDPRLRLHIADGRQFLLNSVGGYDLAIIDSTHPKAVDSWVLYTREFYELVAARLGEGGIVVQWLPLHGMSEREFKVIVRTFVAAFGDMTLWANAGFETHGHVGYAKLVGTKSGPLVIEPGVLAERLGSPRVHQDLSVWGMETAQEVLDLYLADAGEVRRWTAGLPVQTDHHPIVPYTTGYSRGRRMEPSLLLGVRASAPPWEHPALQEAWEAQGMILAGLLQRAAELHPGSKKVALFVQQAGTTRDYYTRLAEFYPQDPDKLFEAGTLLGSLGHPQQARGVYERLLSIRPKDFRGRLNLALVLRGAGEQQAGLAMLSRLALQEPRSAIVLNNLAAALDATGDTEAAARAYEQALSWEPESEAASLGLAAIWVERGEVQRAQLLLRRVLGDNPFVAEAHDLLGSAALRTGDPHLALEHYGRASALHPYQGWFHHRAGVAWQLARQWDKAVAAADAALRLQPEQPAFLVRKAMALAALGKAEQAMELLMHALDLEPGNELAARQLGLLGGEHERAPAYAP